MTLILRSQISVPIKKSSTRIQESALLKPSYVGHASRGKTVVEEEEEGDKLSSDGLNGSDELGQDDDNKSGFSDGSDERRFIPSLMHFK